MSQTLDRVATVVFVVSCILVVGFVGYRQLGLGNPDAATYERGDRLESALQSQLSAGRPRLILNLRSTCQYCTASMPQLKRLVAEAASRWPSLQITVASSEPDDVFLPYLTQHGLHFSERLRLENTDAELERMVVPSILTADGNGVVFSTWIGAISDSRVPPILEALEQVIKLGGVQLGN